METQKDHPRFARCQQCTCEGHVISEVAKTQKPWRECRCEVKNDEFNFYESRIPYVAHHRTKIPQAVSVPQNHRIEFRVLDNIDDTMKSMETALEAQNDAIAALTRPTVCGTKNVAPSNPNRRCANLRIQLSAVFSVGWGGSSKAISNFCDNMLNAHGKIEVSTAANYLFVGSIDPRFRRENTENIIWDVVIGGSALEDEKEQNVVTRVLPELLLSFRPPMIPLLIELYNRRATWFKSGRELRAGQYFIVTLNVPGMEICPCLLPPREWLEAIGKVVSQLLGHLLPLLKELGKIIAKELLKLLKHIDWSRLTDAASWMAANVGFQSKKMVRLEMTISSEGISMGVGCLRNKILTIKTPYGSFEGQYVS